MIRNRRKNKEVFDWPRTIESNAVYFIWILLAVVVTMEMFPYLTSLEEPLRLFGILFYLWTALNFIFWVGTPEVYLK